MKQYKIKIDGKAFDVAVGGVDENGIALVTVNGVTKSVELDPECLGSPKVRTAAVDSVKTPEVFSASSATRPAAVGGPSDKAVVSPLPGVILSIKVSVGDKVSAGESVATVEAMKMENDIESEVGGIVKAVHVQKGDSVLEGSKIVTIL